MKAYKATRSFHYITEDSESRIVQEGETVERASQSLIDSLLADGLVREGRTSQKKEEE